MLNLLVHRVTGRPKRLIKYGSSRQNFIKVTNIKYNGTHSSGSLSYSCGQTDERTVENFEALGALRDYVSPPKR